MTKDKQAQRQRRDARARSAMTSRPRGQQRSGMTMAIIAVGLVVVVVVGFVAVRLIIGSSSNAKGAPRDSVPAAVMRDVTGIPASVFDQVGTGGSRQINYPVKLNGQIPKIGGKPVVMYLGAEYCPYCAAERWPFVATLARFGTWHDLRVTHSASRDVFPDTPTFSFHGASYSSPYISFQGVETATNNLVNGAYTPLDQPTRLEVQMFETYDVQPYFPTQGAIPFIDFGNRWALAGAGYDATVLGGQTMAGIAAALKDPTSPIAQSILGVSNTLAAEVCSIDGGKPASVCQSPGVQAAVKKRTSSG